MFKPSPLRRSLADAQPNERLWIMGHRQKDGVKRLIGMGLAPGTSIEVLQILAGNLVLRLGETRIGIDRSLARNIWVSLHSPAAPSFEETTVMTITPTLSDLDLHQTGQVSGFAITDDPVLRSYKRKILAMGLTPGTVFTVTRIAPLGDPVEIQVRGFKLSLRRDEASFLQVKVLQDETA